LNLSILKMYKIYFIIILIFFNCSSQKDYKENCIVGEKLTIPCTKEYNPVCGCNDKTYPNSCYAEREGVTDWSKGACK